MPRSTSFKSSGGLLAVLLALAVSELLAGVVGKPSILLSVAAFVSRHVPDTLKEAVIETLGFNDKPFLIGLMVAICILAGALLGVAARSRFWIAVLGFGLFGVLGLLAAAMDPLSSLKTAI